MSGEFNAALLQFEQCTPIDAEVLLGIGTCQLRLGQLEAAKVTLTKATQLEAPPSVLASAHEELGKLALEQDDSARAVGELKRAVDLAPHSVAAMHALSGAYRACGESAQALALSQEVDRLRKLDQELADIKRVILEEPQNAEVRFDAGQVCMKMGRLEEGISWIRTVLQCDPDHHRALQLLLDHYEARGLSKQANVYRKRLLEGPSAAQ